MTHCPCCGQVVMPDAIPGAEDGSPTFRRIVAVLHRAGGHWLPGVDLADAVYADDPDGGPETALSTISVIIRRDRHRLRGWRIEGRARHGYRLVPSEVDA